MVSGGTEKAKESKRWLSGGSRLDYGEARFIGFGPLKGRVMAIIFSRQMPDLIRIISLRKANQREQRRYEQAVTDRLGQN